MDFFSIDIFGVEMLVFLFSYRVRKSKNSTKYIFSRFQATLLQALFTVCFAAVIILITVVSNQKQMDFTSPENKENYCNYFVSQFN